MEEKIYDEYGCIRNTYEGAMCVRNQLQMSIENHAYFQLAVGHGTMFHFVMVNLQNTAAELSRSYDDGSNHGLFIGIDRFKSYSINWGNAIGEPGYLGEKWGIEPSGHISTTPADLWPFFNTILTGENYYTEDQPWLEQLGMTKADIGV